MNGIRGQLRYNAHVRHQEINLIFPLSYMAAVITWGGLNCKSLMYNWPKPAERELSVLCIYHVLIKQLKITRKKKSKALMYAAVMQLW
ncbi:uncharacterized protein BO95DRAFT_59993 [Aspergillus brunneoviolaceus CBS 621.78]|uniref:Uncharacterized protein n=1 Tax=Aspergillus brunneoviolaceus CBS 621.78 TaxID=1450534 RepID=A0ACD1GGE0_9EURO|nr:hypothetical protein BO95DRAFT_59993 [Aspergillus brunneoviolaceus CBS 621.78]RAH48228.1 hypothetical protein BO95DRAFT_59993 [Aspergillus brunneoviolaceus CBS 621.78]